MLESNLALGERLKPLVADVTGIVEQLSVDGRNVMFEGAQGAMLDVDLGTYPYVTSSTTIAGGAAAGTGIGPRRLTRCSASSRPTPRASARVRFRRNCSTSSASTCRGSGHEFGSVTGRRRRCGWFDAVALRRSIVHNSCSLLCVTKLDVLDGLDTIRVCVGYKIGGACIHPPPLLSEHFGDAKPFTRSCRDGRRARVGITRYDDLPDNARKYSSGCKSWWGCPSPSFRPDRIGIRPSFAKIPSVELTVALESASQRARAAPADGGEADPSYAKSPGVRVRAVLRLRRHHQPE